VSYVWPLRVYWEDTDAGGVVYYAAYLRFMERARTEWLRALGFEQDALRAQAGVVFAVRRVEVDYRAPARFNDALEVSVRLRRIGGASLTVEQTVMRGVVPLAAARATLACVEAAHFKPARIPVSLLHALEPLREP
jgi:acyl-CoA thioester hydrolase